MRAADLLDDSRRRSLAACAAVGTLVVAVIATGSTLASPVGGSTTPSVSNPFLAPPPHHGHKPKPIVRRPPAHGGATSFDVVVTVLLCIIAAALLAFLIVAFVHRRRHRVWLAAAPPAIDVDPSAISAMGLSPAVVATARAQLDRLREGSPRNAIVACWMRLEASCADEGRPRLVAETSAEFTARILREQTVHARAVDELARLFREARFSEHEMDEAHRALAISSLEDTLSGLHGQPRATAGAGAQAASSPGQDAQDTP